MGVRAGVAMGDGKCGAITMASLKQMRAYSCLLDSVNGAMHCVYSWAFTIGKGVHVVSSAVDMSARLMVGEVGAPCLELVGVLHAAAGALHTKGVSSYTEGLHSWAKKMVWVEMGTAGVPGCRSRGALSAREGSARDSPPGMLPKVSCSASSV
jgi:hypothetical protein